MMAEMIHRPTADLPQKVRTDSEEESIQHSNTANSIKISTVYRPIALRRRIVTSGHVGYTVRMFVERFAAKGSCAAQADCNAIGMRREYGENFGEPVWVEDLNVVMAVDQDFSLPILLECNLVSLTGSKHVGSVIYYPVSKRFRFRELRAGTTADHRNNFAGHSL